MAISYCYVHLVVKNGNFTLFLTSSGQEWQIHIATDIHWSRMAISHCYWHLVVKNDNLTLLLTSSGQARQFHIATDIKWSRMELTLWYWHLMVENGNFTLLLTSSGQELAISYCYWHLVVKNDNWHIYPRSASRSTSQMHEGIYIMGGIWKVFCILQEKVGISCYVSIIRVVNSQLAWYSHVRCNPLNTQQHPWNFPKTPVHNTGQMNLLCPMDPPWIQQRCLECQYTALGRQTHFFRWTAQ